jgi:hypothetical protein
MPYAGIDWTDTSPGARPVLSLDCAAFLAAGDTLVGASLTSSVTLLRGEGPVPTLVAPPYVNGTTMSQLVPNPPAGVYALKFVCATENGQVVELWSNFRSEPEPAAETD